jgi:hypothetical protein
MCDSCEVSVLVFRCNLFSILVVSINFVEDSFRPLRQAGAKSGIDRAQPKKQDAFSFDSDDSKGLRNFSAGCGD